MRQFVSLANGKSRSRRFFRNRKKQTDNGSEVILSKQV